MEDSMTVRSLIEQLSQLDPETVVCWGQGNVVYGITHITELKVRRVEGKYEHRYNVLSEKVMGRGIPAITLN